MQTFIRGVALVVTLHGNFSAHRRVDPMRGAVASGRNVHPCKHE
jgi:hypothetical protein